MRAGSSRWGWALCGWALCGCTALSDFEVRACQADADCSSLSAGVARCEDAVCVPGCASNRHCSSLDPRAPLCSHVGGECVSPTLATGECYLSSGYADEALGPLTADEMLLLGAFSPTLESPRWLTLQLAIDEINAAGGLPNSSGESRPLFGLLCDDAPEAIEGAMLHLVDRLGVRALVASLEPRELGSALSLASTRGRALFLAPSGFGLEPTAAGAESLYALGAAAGDVVTGYGPLIRQMAEASVARGATRELLRVASLAPGREDGSTLTITEVAQLELDGYDAPALEREGRYRVVRIADAGDVRAEQLAALAAYRPDIVLVFLDGPRSGAIWAERTAAIAEIERLAEATPGWLPPLYLFGPRNAEDASLRELGASSASFRARAFGVSAERPLDASVNQALRARYAAAYPAATGVNGWVSPSVYDAVYQLAYAAAAAPRAAAELTAQELLGGLQHVTTESSARVEVGPGASGLELGIAALTQGAPLDLHGTTGAARFDERRTRPGPLRAYCWGADGDVLPLASRVAGDGIELLALPASEGWELACSSEVNDGNE